MDGSFWERSWGTIDPGRVAAYAEGFDFAEDTVIELLKRRGVRNVCDAGCGCGVYSLKLARFGFEVSGFDIAEDAVGLAVRLLSENGYPAGDFRRADVLSTGYPSDCFDAVVARDVIDHMPIRRGVEAVRELWRIVRPGGCVLLTLDAADGEYESEPHEINGDGDYLFTRGKWEGMTFHPYSISEIGKLTGGIVYRLLASGENGFVVALEAETDGGDGRGGKDSDLIFDRIF